MGTSPPAMKTFLLLVLVLTIAVQLSEQQPRRRRRGLAEDLDRRMHHRGGVLEAEKRLHQREDLGRHLRQHRHGVAEDLGATEELERRIRRRRGVAEELERRIRRRRGWDNTYC